MCNSAFPGSWPGVVVSLAVFSFWQLTDTIIRQTFISVTGHGETMTSSAETRTLLNKYYDALLKKEDWPSLLSDDVLLTGTVVKESRGKELFISNDFFRMIRGLKVRQMIVENDNAFALVSYDLVSPKGVIFSSDVAEIWRVKDNKLASLAIYFDTAAFQRSMT
jgi:ketosteroid isomerase-like protein